jgi:membrane protein
MKERIEILKRFFSYNIWTIELKFLPRPKAWLFQILQIGTLATKHFLRDKIQLRASALTFYLILSIVPLLAMAFGIAEGFGLSTMLEKELNESFQGQQQVLEFSLKFAHSLLDTTKSGAVAGVGIVVLFWSVLKLLNHIEDAFNRIWKVSKPRNFLRKLTDYFSILLFAPVLLILASSATVFIAAYIQNIASGHTILNFLSSAVLFFIKFSPYLIIWVLFTLIYIILPNTHVKLLPAIIAGVLAGTAFQLTQWAYINFQVGVSRYNAIYGSFAALPLFLVWAQLSWEIVLIGSELSFSIQNVKRYQYDSLNEELSHGLKMRISIILLNVIIQHFIKGKKPPSEDELTADTGIPYTIGSMVCHLLVKARIINVARDMDDNEGFVPAIDPGVISYGFVTKQLEKIGIIELPVLETKKYAEIVQLFSNLDAYRLDNENQILIKDIPFTSEN